MTKFHRYVAIGDSTTEGLEDPDPRGSYRDWADRLAEHIADAQDDPLEYANLAVRGLRLNEIRRSQLDAALAMRPDVMSIVGGVNDVIGTRCDFAAVRADFAAMFGAAQRSDVTVITFTMPDPSRINPLGRWIRDRTFALNDIIRSEAGRYGATVMDFPAYPMVEDLRLWSDDRLHINTLGHERVGAALAWRLGVEGSDESWALPLPVDTAVRRPRDQLTVNLKWAVRYLTPWLGRGLLGMSYSRSITAKRPVPTVVEKRSSEPSR